ncbi:hypothetical protein ABT272_40570 [Streptomyces sp900105245]|uniref:HTH cro/C1-type domain-containing protein n=1 Tax=Streptomyces sp. 900105245 TaxID=3154379 RepID=A0ABV1UJS0_9ACTN
MGADKPESTPGPEALAYSRALKEIFLRLGESQRFVARALHVDPAQLSRFFSAKENTVAGKKYADELVRLVRASDADVSDAEVEELHRLRRAAQDASPRPSDRVALLTEQVEELRSRTQAAAGREVELAARVEQLLRQVQREEQRADKERTGRHREQAERQEAESRAESAQLDAQTAADRVRASEQALAEARERMEGSEERAVELAAQLEQARRQLAAAVQYARDSDAVLEEQRTQLDALRRELTVLRRQVQTLSEERRSRTAYGDVAETSTQVRLAASGSDAAAGARLDDWVLPPAGARRPAADPGAGPYGDPYADPYADPAADRASARGRAEARRAAQRSRQGRGSRQALQASRPSEARDWCIVAWYSLIASCAALIEQDVLFRPKMPFQAGVWVAILALQLLLGGITCSFYSPGRARVKRMGVTCSSLAAAFLFTAGAFEFLPGSIRDVTHHVNDVFLGNGTISDLFSSSAP